jgi:acetyltransferase-like isoleucine patch superfamily enzyme
MPSRLILKIKRGDSPFFRFLGRVARTFLHSSLPVPAVLKPTARFAYQAHFGLINFVRWALNFCYRSPVFQARCASVGKNLHLWLLPEVRGPVEIHLGDNVNLFGYALIESTWLCGERPKLVIGNRVDLGHNLLFVVNRAIVIDDDVRVASSVRFLDTDDFSADPAARQNNEPPSPDDVKPVHICRNAWIGQSAFILKGVTIGEGAIVGVNSVVTSDIPPYSVAMGNPARVIVKNINRPASEPTPRVGENVSV